MINRRDLLIGGACFATAAAAEGLRPRKHVNLPGVELMAPQVFPEHRAAQTQRLRGLHVGEAMAPLPIRECFIHAFNTRDTTADTVQYVDSKYKWRKTPIEPKSRPSDDELQQ